MGRPRDKRKNLPPVGPPPRVEGKYGADPRASHKCETKGSVARARKR